MEINGTPQEIAALIRALQEQQRTVTYPVVVGSGHGVQQPYPHGWCGVHQGGAGGPGPCQVHTKEENHNEHSKN